MGIAFERAKKRRHMGQRYAKHQMQSGVRVYHQRHYQQAIARWRTALSRLRNAEDRFITLGYMAQAFCDCSDYESMLHYALQQMELANARHDDFMKSEALLNLSKAYERLADYGKAVNYGRASLQHPNIDARSPGYAHLGIALAHLGLSQFHTALEEFERAMAIAGDTGDKLLELQICVGLGTLFTLLRDLSKALIFLRNALSILQLVTADNVHAKYKSIILYQLSVVLRLKGSLVDARQVCDETLRLAYQTSNRATYARALASMADINRELGESEAKETITKSWARYEQAFRIMRQIKDRMGETIVLGSMAKSASESRSHYTGQCECQAIQLNRKCLELAKMIGCKHAMLKCHLRLQELYGQLEDEDSEEAAAQICVSLIQEMELFCNFCGQRYGDRDDSLQALRCSHIFHEKCLHKFLAEDEDLNCPKCKRRAIVMEDLNAKTSAATRTSDIAESVVLPSILHPDEPSTSSASQPGRKLLKLTPLNIPLYDEQQQCQPTKDIVRQQSIQDHPFPLQRETTAPPSVATFAEARATVRIPRTTSVPLADSGEIVYASSNYLREYGTTGDVFSLANRMIEDASESLRSPPPVGSSTTVGGGSTMRTIKSARIRPKSSLCAGASTSRVNELRRLATAMEVGAESSQQEFSLSASTNSIAFYPSAMSSNETQITQLCPKQTAEPERAAGKLDDSGATSAASFSASTSASGGSTEKNSPPASRRNPQPPPVGGRLPSRAERMRALASARHFISEDTDAESSKRLSSIDSEKSAAVSQTDKGPLELTILKPRVGHSPHLDQFGRAKTIDIESDLDSTGPAKKKKPPPPPRKPCCPAGASGTFPSFSSELLDAPPPTLAFPTMLERAMRTVFEEDIEEPIHHSTAVNDSIIVEYPPPLILSNNVGCPTFKKTAKGSLSQDQDSEASEDTVASQAEAAPMELQNNDDKPNCSDRSRTTKKANAFVVRHGAGVTDL